MASIKRFLRRLWLKLRGTSPVALILTGCAVLSAAALGIYLLVAPGDAAQGTLSSLFPAVRRDDIKEVLVHNKYGVEYLVKSEYATDDNGNVSQNPSFWLDKDGAEAPLDSEKLSYFVVGTGQNYVYEAVVSAPEASDPDYDEKMALYERKKKEFGFGENAPYYVLTKRSDGQKYKVYYGKSALSGDGYYVMLEGKEAVYVTYSTFIGELLEMKGPESLLSPVLYIPSEFQYAYGYPKYFAVYDTVRNTEAGTRVTTENTDYTSVCFTYFAADGKTLLKDSVLLRNLKDSAGKEVLPDGLTLALRAFLTDKTVGKLGEKGEVFSYTYPDTEEDEELRGTTESFTIVSIDALETETVRFSFGWNPARRALEIEMRDLEIAFREEVYKQKIGKTPRQDCENAYKKQYGAQVSPNAAQYLGWLNSKVDNIIQNEAYTSNDRMKSLQTQISDLEEKIVGYPMHLFTEPKELLPYFTDAEAAMNSVQQTLEATGTVVRMGVTGDVIEELGLYAHRVSFSYSATSDYLNEDNYLPAELLVSKRTENGTRYVASLLSDLVLEVDATIFDYLDEETLYFVDSTLQSVPVSQVESMTFVWNYGDKTTVVGDKELTLMKGTYRIEITMGLAQNATGDYYEKIEAVRVTLPDGTVQAVNADAFQQLFYRLVYCRYGDEHSLSEEEVAKLTADDENCALGLYYTLRDGGALSFFEFYPISSEDVGNLVLVRTQNGAGGGIGESFAVYGTTLKDIARGFISLLTGGDLTAADRYS